jgi:hypothetical protein
MNQLPETLLIDKDTVDPIEIFILDNEPAGEAADLWRKQLLRALNWSEHRIIETLQRKATEFNRAGFSNSELIVKDLIEDVKGIFAEKEHV